MGKISYRSFPMKPVQMSMNVLESLRLEDYWMEKKFDGHRALAVFNGSATLWTREWRPIRMTDNLQDQLSSLKVRPGTVLDGEIWNPVKRGGWHKDSSTRCVLTFWDVMMLDGVNLSALPLEDRRRELEGVLSGSPDDIRMVETMEATLENAKRVQREASEFRASEAVRSGYVHGVVLKRRRSPRRDNPVRSVEHPDWLKVVFRGLKGWEPRQ